LARENPYYSPSSEESDTDDEEHAQWQPKKFDSPNLCAICGVLGTKTCGKCHSEYYCSREHQLVDWSLAGHKQACCQLLSDTQLQEIAAKRQKYVFSEKEIVSEPEGQGADGEEEEAQKQYQKEQSGGSTEVRALVPAGDEIYENTEVDVDEAFLKFQLRVQLYPEQVIRYTRTEYGHVDAEPLWVSDKGKLDPKVDVPACLACGADRTFEFQILSTLLNYLGVSHVATDSLDWGSLYVYTCKENCPTQTNYIEELLWKQDFSEEGVQLPTGRPGAVRADQ
jgi:pre-rRNA-processing protein TSR4